MNCLHYWASNYSAKVVQHRAVLKVVFDTYNSINKSL